MGCVSANSPQRMHQNDEFVDCIRKIFIESTKLQVISPSLAHRLNLPVWKRFEQAASKSLELGLKYVTDNTAHNRTGQDGVLKQMMTNGEMSMEEISRIIVDMFIAGADTVSTSALVAHFAQYSHQILRRHRMQPSGHSTFWHATTMFKPNCTKRYRE